MLEVQQGLFASYSCDQEVIAMGTLDSGGDLQVIEGSPMQLSLAHSYMESLAVER